MWVANAATIAPSADTLDGKVHLTVANLNNKFHRSLEAPVTESLLKAILRTKRNLASIRRCRRLLGDEGRQTTIVSAVITVNRVFNFLSTGEKKVMIPGLPLLSGATDSRSQRGGGVDQVRNPQQVIFAQQNPDVIDQGVFHNDVIAVSNRAVLFCHQQAFARRAHCYWQTCGGSIALWQ